MALPGGLALPAGAAVRKGVKEAVDQVHHIGRTAHEPERVPQVRGINLAALATVANALAASGRDDLAANIVEILYYCADQRTWRNNVVPFYKDAGGGVSG